MITNVHEKCDDSMIITSFFLGLNNIAARSEIKDLVITIDSKLGFALYINNIIARAHAKCNLNYKCFIYFLFYLFYFLKILPHYCVRT